MLDVQPHRLLDDLAQQDRDIRQEIADIQRFHAEGLLARKGEQFAHQAGGPGDGLVDRLQLGIVRVADRVAVQEFIAIEPDGREQIVEIMRHTAGELADGLHFVGLAELAFQLLPGGHIDDIGDPLAAARRGKGEVDIDRAVLAVDARLGRITAAGHGGGEGIGRRAPVLPVEQVAELDARQRRSAGELDQGRVHVLDHRGFRIGAIQPHHAEGRIAEHVVQRATGRTRFAGLAPGHGLRDTGRCTGDRKAIHHGAAGPRVSGRPLDGDRDRAFNPVTGLEAGIDTGNALAAARLQHPLGAIAGQHVLEGRQRVGCPQSQPVAQGGIGHRDVAIGAQRKQRHR